MVQKHLKCIFPYREDPLIRKMRVQAWYFAVVQASGLSTRELERMFREDKGRKVNRSCIWNKYRRGEVVPRSGRREGGKLNLVEQVEASYPGTAKWLSSPMWRLADKAPIEMSEIRQIYEKMSPNFRELFILPAYKASDVFWRKPIEYENLADSLRSLGTLESFVALLTLIREAEVTQNHLDFECWINDASQFTAIEYFDELGNLSVIYELCDYLVKRWTLLLSYQYLPEFGRG
jgi:hypothetical protein